MADFIPKMFGDKVEEFVGDTMNKVLGKKKEEEEEEKQEEGGLNKMMSLVGGKDDDDKGFGLGDALSMVSGGDDKKEEEKEGGGPNVMGAIGSFFK